MRTSQISASSFEKTGDISNPQSSWKRDSHKLIYANFEDFLRGEHKPVISSGLLEKERECRRGRRAEWNERE